MITKPYDKTRRFVLRSGSFYVGPLDRATMDNRLVMRKEEAMVLDWRDNEQVKAKFFSAIFGAPFTPELI